MLNAPEVDTLFSHPLASFLSTVFPERAEPRGPFLEAEAHAETAAVELQYHTYSDVPGPWSNHHPLTSNTEDSAGSAGGHVMRMHRFLTGREAGGIKPIYGLTACVFCLLPPLHYCTVLRRYVYLFPLVSAILIRTAAIAYGRPPDFPVQARGEPEINERVAWSLRHPGKRLEEAMRRERFDAERAARVWDEWEGGKWRTGKFKQRVPSRL